MKKAKEYTIIKTRRNRESEVTGTLPELVDYFKYTLECGNSWNPKINKAPKTIRGLLSSLDKSVQETQGGSYTQDSYRLKD